MRPASGPVDDDVLPPSLRKQEKHIAELKAAKDKAIESQQFEEAAKWRDQGAGGTRKLEKAREKVAPEPGNAKCRSSGKMKSASVVPAVGVLGEDGSQGNRAPATHGTGIENRHQLYEVVAAISKALRRSRADLKRSAPSHRFVHFSGPTGVGKPLARAGWRNTFSDPDALIQIDMSEYMDKFMVSRMVGSPLPGYVGHDEGGQLTEKVRLLPYSVVLFDEVEKAHPDVMHVLLQVLEEGMLIDSLGRRGISATPSSS